MIKINVYLRFALIVACLIGGAALTAAYGFWYALPLFLVALVLLAGYILLGTIQSTSELMQAQRFEEAERQLSLTKFPRYLYPANRAYYYLLRANLAQARKDTKEAETYLHKASTIKMPSANETAVVQLQLANIAAQKGQWPEVNKRLQAVKKLDVSEPMIREQTGQLEKAYRNRGNVRLAQRMGVRPGAGGRPGGKRRRPRIR